MSEHVILGRKCILLADWNNVHWLHNRMVSCETGAELD